MPSKDTCIPGNVLASVFMDTNQDERMAYRHDITGFKPSINCTYSPLPLVAQLEMSSCSVTGENKGLWGEPACNRLFKSGSN